MRSLRRDLCERRLWPLAIVIVAAIVAVPFLLRAHSRAVTIAPPSASSATSSPGVTGAGHSAVDTQRTTPPTSRTRDPFQPAGVTGAAHTSRKSPTTSTAHTTPTAATMSSSPAPVSRTTATTTVTTTTPAPTMTAPAATPTPVVSSPSPVTKPAATSHTLAPTHTDRPRPSWDIYSVDLRIGPSGRPVTHRDVARLMPLPYERVPQAMYMGVTDHGRRAVFALGAGVEARSADRKRSLQAFCSPSRADCALVVIPAGGRIMLRYVSATGAQRTLVLDVSRITTRLTRSASAERTARHHVSAVGLCELKLGDPIGFLDPAEGSVKLPSTAACRRDRRVVPFPGSLGAGSSVRR